MNEKDEKLIERSKSYTSEKLAYFDRAYSLKESKCEDEGKPFSYYKIYGYLEDTEIDLDAASEFLLDYFHISSDAHFEIKEVLSKHNKQRSIQFGGVPFSSQYSGEELYWDTRLHINNSEFLLFIWGDMGYGNLGPTGKLEWDCG